MIRLKEVMRSKGISNIELAERLKLTPVSVSYMVTGKTDPNTSRLFEVARALDVPVWELLVPPSEVQTEIETQKRFLCPHCGKPLHVEIKGEE